MVLGRIKMTEFHAVCGGRLSGKTTYLFNQIERLCLAGATVVYISNNYPATVDFLKQYGINIPVSRWMAGSGYSLGKGRLHILVPPYHIDESVGDILRGSDRYTAVFEDNSSKLQYFFETEHYPHIDEVWLADTPEPGNYNWFARYFWYCNAMGTAVYLEPHPVFGYIDTGLPEKVFQAEYLGWFV